MTSRGRRPLGRDAQVVRVWTDAAGVPPHLHVAELDEKGDGWTSSNAGHRHRIAGLDVEAAEGHRHRLTEWRAPPARAGAEVPEAVRRGGRG